jgi:predicted transcriptional regulator
MNSKKPTTEFLNNRILASKDIKNFLNDNEKGLDHKTFGVFLAQLIEDKNVSKTDIFESAQINDTTGYHILNGRRLPSRDKVIKLSVALGLNLDKTNRLLRKAKHGELYVKDKRDAITIYSINNGVSLMKLNELLYDEACDVLE